MCGLFAVGQFAVYAAVKDDACPVRHETENFCKLHGMKADHMYFTRQRPVWGVRKKACSVIKRYAGRSASASFHCVCALNGNIGLASWRVEHAAGRQVADVEWAVHPTI